MPQSTKTRSQHKEVKRGEKLSDERLLDLVQRQTFLYFWDGAQPTSGLARDHVGRLADPPDDDVAIGGSGFGVMATIVACERGWVTRDEARARLSKSLDCLEKATCYHGLYPHFMHGDTGATKPSAAKTTALTWSRPHSCSRVSYARAPIATATRRRKSAFAIASPISGRKRNGIGTPRAAGLRSPGTGAIPTASH